MEMEEKMNKDIILEYLEKNGLSDVDILKEDDELLLATGYYDFDDAEKGASAEYAKTQVEEEEDSALYNEYLVNYLVDMAVDHMGEVMEEIIEEENVDAQYLTYEMDPEDMNSVQVAMLFSKGDIDKDLEDILDELEL